MFHANLTSFISLMQRSADTGDGWRRYSDMLKPLVIKRSAEFPGLFEVDEVGSIVRLTAEGKVVVKWMNYVPK